jgi:uncharacterized protein (DUF1800 family)
MPVLACDLAPLVPFGPTTDSPWDQSAALHLFRRLGYGLAPVDVPGILSQNPVNLIVSRLRAAAALPNMARPSWYNFTLSDYSDQQELVDQIFEWNSAWVNDMRDNALRAKMGLFWSNHFVTQREVYNCPSWMWEYHDILQTHAFGDFREFVRAIGKTPAMLVYLNGVQNTRFEPNENFARELFELFTLGENNNYTQADIVDAARALTGWNGFTEACAPINFLPTTHDPGMKTIFGQTAAFDYDSLIDLIFTERAVECSTHICRKLYVHFVSPEVDEAIVTQLASSFRQNNWNLLSVYEQLFSSAHFFSPPLRGVRVKDPLEFALELERTLGTTSLRDEQGTIAVWFQAANLGQAIFDPPDVAGWPGDRVWLNASLLAVRRETSQQVIFLTYQQNRLLFSDWAKTLNIGDQSDVEEVTRAIVDYVFPEGLDRVEDYERAIDVLKSEVPSFYFEQNLWSLDFEYAPDQVAILLDYLTRRPEFQLC